MLMIGAKVCKTSIEVWYSDNWRDYQLFDIPNVYKHRDRVNTLVERLNKKYFGNGHFWTREISYWRKPCGEGWISGIHVE